MGNQMNKDKCNHCGKYGNKYKGLIIHKDGTHEITYLCPKCRKKLRYGQSNE
jgi:hypothetical protein